MRNLARKNRLASNLLIRSCILIVTGVISILTLRLLLDTFPKGIVGKYLVLIAIGQILMLLDLGIGFSTSFLMARNSVGNFNYAYVVRGTRTLIALGIFTAMLAITFGHFLISMLFDGYDFEDFRNYIIIVIGASFSNIFGPILHSLVIRKKVSTYFLLDGLRPVIVLIGVFLAHHFGSSILVCYVFWSISSVLPGVIAMLIEHRNIFKFEAGNANLETDSYELLKAGIPFQLSTIGNLANSSLPPIIISSILGPAAVVPYQLLMRGLTLYRATLGAIWLAIWPDVVSNKGLAFQLKRLRLISKQMFLTSIAIAILNYLLAPRLLIMLFGFSDPLSRATLCVCSLLFIAYSLEIVPAAIANSIEDQKKKSGYILLSGFVSSILSILLIPKIGYVGSLISILVTYVFIYLIPLKSLSSKRSHRVRRMYWKS